MKILSRNQIVAFIIFHISLGFMFFFTGLRWFEVWDFTSSVLTLGTATSFLFIRKSIVKGLYIGASIGTLVSFILILSNLASPEKIGPAISVAIMGPLNALYFHVLYIIFTQESKT